MASPGAIVAVILLTIGAIGCIGAVGIILQRRFGSSSRAAYNNPFADPAPSRGPFSWVGDRVRQFKAKSSRTATGAYEGDTMYRAYPDDDAWDHRVGREADGFGPYDEEHELGAMGGGRQGPGANAGAGPYTGATGDLGAPDAGQQMERGRSRTRSPPRVQVENPFGDNADPSNLDTERASVAKKDRKNISSDRRSVFREAV